MKKTRFTESRIVSILKEADAGMKFKEVCRKHGYPMRLILNRTNVIESL